MLFPDQGSSKTIRQSRKNTRDSAAAGHREDEQTHLPVERRDEAPAPTRNAGATAISAPVIPTSGHVTGWPMAVGPDRFVYSLRVGPLPTNMMGGGLCILVCTASHEERHQG